MSTKQRKGYRLLEIDGLMWQWMRGKSGVVKVYSPVGEGFVIPANEAATTVETVCECCHEPDGGEMAVTLPGTVAKYIRHNLR